jgi:hypothetical protein
MSIGLIDIEPSFSFGVVCSKMPESWQTTESVAKSSRRSGSGMADGELATSEYREQADGSGQAAYGLS